MKVVILAGGLGTRLSEETALKPKPMIEIGGKPILWHIMSIYAAFGHTDFCCALGYKAELVKQYFLNFFALNNDLSIDLGTGKTTIHERQLAAWKIHLVDTGPNTMTGGRIKRLQSLIGNETFMATYGDGVSDVDIEALLAFHRAHGKLATVTAVRPPARFGGLEIRDGRVERFNEKPQTGEGWINGGFFVFEPSVFQFIAGDTTVLEREPLERLSADGQLMAYQHGGFWQPMDTLREKRLLEELWDSGSAPWRKNA